MLGNAPTRMVVCAELDSAAPPTRTRLKKNRLFNLLAPDHHGQDTALLFLLVGGPLAFCGTRGSAGNQVRQRSVFENLGSRVAHIEKHLIKRAVGQIAVDQRAKLLSISKGRHRTINQTHDLTQPDLARIAAQLVAAFSPSHALDHACVLQFEEDQLKEFFRKILFVGDFADLDGALTVMPGEHHHGLERVESLLRDFHSGRLYAIKSTVLIDFMDVTDISNSRTVYGRSRTIVNAILFSALGWNPQRGRGGYCASDCSFGRDFC